MNTRCAAQNARINAYLQRRVNLPGKIPMHPSLNTVLEVHLWYSENCTDDVYGNLEIQRYIKDRKPDGYFGILYTYDTYWLKFSNLNTFLDVVAVYPENGELQRISLLDMLRGVYPDMGRVSPKSNAFNIIMDYLKE